MFRFHSNLWDPVDSLVQGTRRVRALNTQTEQEIVELLEEVLKRVPDRDT
jgi:hypothetical protein